MPASSEAGLSTAAQAGTHRNPRDQTPDDDAGSHRPRPSAGNRDAANPTGNTTTGKPNDAANRAAPKDPRDAGDDTNATKPAPEPDDAANDTAARERRASRARNGTDAGPPAHQETAHAARRKSENDADTRPAKPRPNGPPTAKTRNDAKDAPAASAADNANESAPAAQPTATPRPPPNSDRTTDATKPDADAGNRREPATTTNGRDTEDTRHLPRENKSADPANARPTPT